MIPLVAKGLVSYLSSQGLEVLGKVITTKGKEWVEERTGVDLSHEEVNPQELEVLRKFEKENLELLLNALVEFRKQESTDVAEHLKDRQNAREMQVEAIKSGNKPLAFFLPLFVTAWSIFCMFYLWFVTFGNVPKDNVRFADSLTGFFTGTIVATMFNFLMGTSRGSSEHGSVIHEIAKKLTERLK